jgi:hypothetical protein
MDDKNGISIFTTESAATQIPRDDYASPMNTEDAQKSDHRVPPKRLEVFVACAARCSTDLGRYPRGQNRFLYFHSSAPLYMMLII